MSLYKHFIGIDIGKFEFFVGVYGSKKTESFSNTTEGFKKFNTLYKSQLKQGLSVLEVTGGYEMALLDYLCDKGYSVHRANTRKVKNFIRSFGNEAKTDNLDAKRLALYGYERSERLDCFVSHSKVICQLQELVQRRLDLKQILVAEKNRSQAPRMSESIKNSCKKIIAVLENEQKTITEQIAKLYSAHPKLKKMCDILKTIPGIGDIVAFQLVALIPEIGTVNRRQIASLVGVAPRAKDSGTYRGYRATAPGRDKIKPILFISAMSASKSHSELGSFYKKLIEAGKKKMVALTALMRKIIVIANARIKEYLNEGNMIAH